jgi:hypothetical protein
MKIIISSKEFQNCLTKAIERRCEFISINCLKKEMKFTCNKDFSTDIHICNERELQTFSYSFNPLKTFIILNFLNLLNEQPIVVEFDFITDSETDITITQTVFRI